MTLARNGSANLRLCSWNLPPPREIRQTERNLSRNDDFFARKFDCEYGTFAGSARKSANAWPNGSRPHCIRGSRLRFMYGRPHTRSYTVSSASSGSGANPKSANIRP